MEKKKESKIYKKNIKICIYECKQIFVRSTVVLFEKKTRTPNQ